MSAEQGQLTAVVFHAMREATNHPQSAPPPPEQHTARKHKQKIEKTRGFAFSNASSHIKEEHPHVVVHRKNFRTHQHVGAGWVAHSEPPEAE